MKALGIVRKIDSLGRLVIPKEVRKVNGWEEGTPLEMFVSEDGLFVKEYGLQEKVQEIIQKLNAAEEHVSDDSTRSAIKQAIDFISRR